MAAAKKSSTSKKKDDELDLTTAEGRQKALTTAISQLEKTFGKGTVMKMGERTQMNVEAVSTGSLGLDLALGVGGLPRGRVVEIYGPESSGNLPLLSIAFPKSKKVAGLPLSSTRNTPSIRYMQEPSVWTSTISSSPSPTPASKLSKSVTRWYGPELWTSLLLTL